MVTGTNLPPILTWEQSVVDEASSLLSVPAFASKMSVGSPGEATFQTLVGFTLGADRLHRRA